MGRLLLTWSDRGQKGGLPSHHTARNHGDMGPVMRLIQHSEMPGFYDQAIVLTTPGGAEPAGELVEQLSIAIEQVSLMTLDVADPSDYHQLFYALGNVVAHVNQQFPSAKWQRDILLSAGTPQAQTLWLILVQAQSLEGRMLQVIPPAFVPHPHPKPVKTVCIDMEGFPEITALREEVHRLRAAEQIRAGRLVGHSAGISGLLLAMSKVAASNLPCLILGETGTGKELVARGIHCGSSRAGGPFVAENCGGLAGGILTSQLFGHEPGAFTGAATQHRGLFEQAHGGSLFLDEVGELGAREQAHLLRVLQDGTFRRVGGQKIISVNVRIIAATHQPLYDLVQRGKFRADLYYRLKGAELRVPPLRERRGDISVLIRHFLKEANCPHVLKIASSAMAALENYSWPGNVRELRAEVMRWTVFGNDMINLGDLSPEILSGTGDDIAEKQSAANSVLPPADDSMRPGVEPALSNGDQSLSSAVRAAERAAITAALKRTHHNLSQTARVLKIDRNTLKRKMTRLGLR